MTSDETQRPRARRSRPSRAAASGARPRCPESACTVVSARTLRRVDALDRRRPARRTASSDRRRRARRRHSHATRRGPSPSRSAQSSTAASPRVSHVRDDLRRPRQRRRADLDSRRPPGSRNQPLDRDDEDRRGAGGLQRREQVPDVVRRGPRRARRSGPAPRAGAPTARPSREAARGSPGRSSSERVHHHVAAAARGDDALEHQLEPRRRARAAPRARPGCAISTAWD